MSSFLEPVTQLLYNDTLMVTRASKSYKKLTTIAMMTANGVPMPKRRLA